MKIVSRCPVATADALGQRVRTACLSAALVLLAVAAAAPAPSEATDRHRPPLTRVTCAELATGPANGLAGNPVVKSVTSQVVPASPPNVSYCRVDLLYGTNEEQNINIRVGLPLNSLDGGTGGVEGAWNGRTQGVGSGGCAGNLNVTAPVNAGYNRESRYQSTASRPGPPGGACEVALDLPSSSHMAHRSIAAYSRS
ncbi:MAG TPA: hypothetical protein VLD36_13705 [Burkholderiales bacterium]|nr:hypothetical protein [Burkholderiales bacterium]